MGFCAVADGRRQWLARQHVRARQLAVDDPIQQDLPVCLRLKCYIQPLIFKKALLIGNRQRGHVGKLDEAEGKLRFLKPFHRDNQGCRLG